MLRIIRYSEPTNFELAKFYCKDFLLLWKLKILHSHDWISQQEDFPH